jgi:hypothetical protein
LLHLVGSFIRVIEDARNHKPFKLIRRLWGKKRKLCAAYIFLISKVFLALHMRGDNIKIINIRTHLKTTEWQVAKWIEEAQYGA